MERSLGQQMCRTAGVFQAITALPTMFVMGACAWDQLYYPYSSIYTFVTASLTGLMAAGILFIIFVQNHPRNTKTSIFYFEIVKSTLATALWLWLILDSIFGPANNHRRAEDRIRKIVEAALCFIVLPIIFYPTLGFAIYEKTADTVVDEEHGESEREPLLSGPST